MGLRWGLVGLGALAQRLGPAFREASNGRLVACASRTIETAREYARRNSVDRVYPSFQELVRDPMIDAVYVATPNHLHTPVVLAAAASGKHVLCEKPMAPTVAEAQEMIDACRSAGVLLRVGFYLRFLSPVQAAAAMVREGRIGSVRELTLQRLSAQSADGLVAWRRDPNLATAGVLMDVGVHLMDLARVILDEPIVRVFALAHPPRTSGRTDDTATTLLEFAGGCQAILRCSRELPLGANDLQLFGTGGMIATGPLRWADRYWLALRTPEGVEEREYPVDDLYCREIEAFGDEVAGTRTPMATGEEGLLIVRAAEAAIKSMETGGVTVL